MSVYSITTYIRENNKVYFRVLVSSGKKRYSTGIKGNPKNFNKEKGEFRSQTPDSGKNDRIQEKKAEISSVLKRLEVDKPDFTIHDFHNNYFHVSGKSGNETLVGFMRDEAKLRKKSSKRTKQIYETTAKHLERFRPEARIKDVDFDFLTRFHAFLMSDEYDEEGEIMREAMINNTANMYLKKLRVFIRLAINKKKMKDEDYPFRFFPLKDDPTWRDFLEEHQVQAIIDLQNLKPYQEEARRKFIFQCYTGLRFSDIIKLEWKDIKSWQIVFEQQKGSVTNSIPIVPNAQKIVGVVPENLNQKVFRKISNKNYNEYIRELTALAGIGIHVTSHVGRHTFATLALTYGMSTEAVQAILGQKSIKTTQIYAKIINKKIEAEMKRFTL